jgi:GMP synthase-like glutamine amidotransferase
MKVHWLQHVPFEGLGFIETWLSSVGADLSVTRFWAEQTLPPPRDIDMLFVMGGPMGVGDERKYPWLSQEKRFIEAVIGQGTVIVGICLGAQLVAEVLGAAVRKNEFKEIGWFSIERCPSGDSRLYRLLPPAMMALHWHHDCFGIPLGSLHLLRSEGCAAQGFMVDDRILGLQCHLEPTRQGVLDLLANCRADMTPGPWVQSEEEIIAKTGYAEQAHKVLAGLLDYLRPSSS